MKIKLDENLPTELAENLRVLGHDTDTVMDENLRGAVDPVVIGAASESERILFTLDKGIANLQRYPLHSHAGVVLFRPDSLGRIAVLSFIRPRLAHVLANDLAGRLTVVSSSRIRLR